MRGGAYVVAEVPNVPLILFMLTVIFAVASYPGFWQSLWAILAYASLAWWAYQEARSGRSRFRRFLGYTAGIAVVGALLLKLGF